MQTVGLSTEYLEGAGVAGVASAYQLAKKGFHVTVLESSASEASQCSAVPAGGMQKSNPTVNHGYLS